MQVLRGILSTLNGIWLLEVIKYLYLTAISIVPSNARALSLAMDVHTRRRLFLGPYRLVYVQLHWLKYETVDTIAL